MEVFDADARLRQVIGKILGHFFRQGRDQDLVFVFGLPADLTDEVVNLSLDGADVDLGIQEAGRADDLLGAEQLVLLLIGARSRGDKKHLIDVVLEFPEIEGAVVQGGREPEAVADQGLLARAVAAVHGSDLGDRHVRFVYNNKKIIVKKVHEGHGRLALLHEIQVAGIVFYAGTETGLPHHLHIEIGALGNALSLQEHVLSLKILHAVPQLHLNVVTGGVDLFLGDDIVGGGIDQHVLELAVDAAGQGVGLADPVDLVSEPLDAQNELTALGGKDLDRVAADAEVAAVERHIIAGVLDRHQVADHLVAVLLHTGPEGDRHPLELVGAAQAVDAGYARHHDHVPALRQRGGRGQTELVDLVVDHGILGDIGVALGNVSLRLVVIIIAHKILHGVLRKKLLHLAVELSRQGLVVGNDQGRFVQSLDDVRHGEGLAGSRHAQQSLKLVAFFKSFYEFFNRLRLVAGRGIFRMKYKVIHLFPLVDKRAGCPFSEHPACCFFRY